MKKSVFSTIEHELCTAGLAHFIREISLNIVTAAANNVALVEDDTSACASPTAGMAGGTTAATGWNFAANGGMTLGNGTGTVTVAPGTYNLPVKTNTLDPDAPTIKERSLDSSTAYHEAFPGHVYQNSLANEWPPQNYW